MVYSLNKILTLFFVQNDAWKALNFNIILIDMVLFESGTRWESFKPYKRYEALFPPEGGRGRGTLRAYY